MSDCVNKRRYVGERRIGDLNWTHNTPEKAMYINVLVKLGIKNARQHISTEGTVFYNSQTGRMHVLADGKFLTFSAAV